MFTTILTCAGLFTLVLVGARAWLWIDAGHREMQEAQTWND